MKIKFYISQFILFLFLFCSFCSQSPSKKEGGKSDNRITKDTIQANNQSIQANNQTTKTRSSHLFANAEIPAHQVAFSYGVNTGYYNDSWSDRALAEIAVKAGVKSTRLYLPDDFLEKYGMDIRTADFKSYSDDLGLKDLTLFVGSPAPNHRDMKVFKGSDEPSYSFKGLYEPSWLPDGSINKKNTYADYIFRVYQKYGKHIAYWEVWNEPDFSDDWGVATDTSKNQRNWFNTPPEPKDLKNLKCPVFYYIRMLRVTYEVIKKLNPNQLISTGGIGYESFLYNILKYSDNPDQGKITKEYPLQGGAYFEVLSFHEYPFYYLKKWNEVENKMEFFRHSDAAVNTFFDKKNKLEALLEKAGYNGTTYPKKYVICTETNIPSHTLDKKENEDEVGSPDEQRNYVMKLLILAQKTNIKQIYLYQLGQTEDLKRSQDVYELMGLYANLKKSLPGQEKLTELGVGFKTTSEILYGYTFDKAMTAAMNLNKDVDGAAFKKGINQVYVVWAKTVSDKCECSKAVIKPSFFNNKKFYRKEWDYSRTHKADQAELSELKVDSSPVFYTTK